MFGNNTQKQKEHRHLNHCHMTNNSFCYRSIRGNSYASYITESFCSTSI